MGISDKVNEQSVVSNANSIVTAKLLTTDVVGVLALAMMYDCRFGLMSGEFANNTISEDDTIYV